MVFPVKLPALENMKVSRVVIVSGLLTFLYIIELSIGVRTVYYTFKLWTSLHYVPPSTQFVSWTLCVACLLLCVASSFTVNVLSALWEQKQMKENGKEKNAIRFAFHIIVDGMVWRYVCLWFSDDKKQQKKEALLLAMIKFLFTQFFTIPLVILHASLLENLDEVIYDVCSVLCISVNFLLTCTVFNWCRSEVDELKDWNFETVGLVPLIFCQGTNNDQKPNTADENTSENEVEESEKSSTSEPNKDLVEIAIVRIIVLFQTFCFSFGRLLALGILLKLAGIYAVSIMFLQLLISVLYLKFQVPFLVSDSLSKWRQLTRLAFMSYILIFEWHLNRDPKTGYDFTSNMKHSLLYYCIATLESLFYFVTWAITESYTSTYYFDEVISQKQKFVRNIFIIGSLSLVFSLTVHLLLMFWQSRRLSIFMHSVQRHYLSSKLKMPSSGGCLKRRTEPTSRQTQVEISNPIPIDNGAEDFTFEQKSLSHTSLEKTNSYKDLREPLDDQIEIYVRKSGSLSECKTIRDTPDTDYNKLASPEEKEYYSTTTEENFNVNKKITEQKEKDFKMAPNNIEGSDEQAAVMHIMNEDQNHAKSNVTNANLSTDNNTDEDLTLQQNNYKNSEIIDQQAPTSKSKVSLFSESINEGWNKLSTLSKKFTGTMQNQLQKRKDQFQRCRSTSIKQDRKSEQENSIEEHEHTQCSNDKVAKEDIASSTTGSFGSENSENVPVKNKTSEGYFIGDSRCYDQEYHSTEDFDGSGEETDTSETNETEIYERKFIVDLHKEVGDSEPAHCNIDEKCPEHYNDDETYTGRCNVKEPCSDHCNGNELCPDHCNGNELCLNHCKGNEPCPCFVCVTFGEGQILRRRSFSLPPADRRHRQNLLLKKSSNDLSDYSPMVRHPPVPDIVRVDMKSETSSENMEYLNIPFPPRVNLKGGLQNLKKVSVDSRVEHYV